MIGKVDFLFLLSISIPLNLWLTVLEGCDLIFLYFLSFSDAPAPFFRFWKASSGGNSMCFHQSLITLGGGFVSVMTCTSLILSGRVRGQLLDIRLSVSETNQVCIGSHNLWLVMISDSWIKVFIELWNYLKLKKAPHSKQCQQTACSSISR